ncbi:sensor histidine kinase [Anaerocolumna aminovalerica]|jgi:signal transduction histidine kinase|uniref:sensor histidine kinase n=1 Tax=Anaerocolumna aminovalerica TaxID=1527 RepID=UPI00248BB07C|nr:HAMP domain-containing sensor histidine kinase [Anaerocolumna aminovalerica]
MEGTIRILRRFISATMIISTFLLIFNFILLGVWVFKGMNEGHSPGAVVQSVAEGLHPSSNSYSLDSSPAKLLKQNNAWAMLIDGTGHIAWNYMLPDELPETFSLADVAKFSRNYLMDYPVFVWEHDEGLVVVGYPKESLAKYQHILPTGWVSSLPLRITSLLIGNIALALLLSLFIGSRLIRSIHPLTQGIQNLAEDKEVYVEPKGVLANLAQSVNRAASLLKQRNDSLKTRDEARSNWIAGISHDIRTPLSMVLGYASNLEENSDIPTEQRLQAGIIRQQAEKLRSLVNDLNLVSMLEYEMQPLDKKPIRLSALARQIASEFLNNGLDERFKLVVEIIDESAQVNGDERLLARAITNLVQNSINHNPDGCQIRLQTSLHEGNRTCSFVVADNGKGIYQNELPDLLEFPYSSKRKHPRQNGHGLGLPMVARIAKAHQGHLILSSDIGKGLRAEIVLPSIESD